MPSASLKPFLARLSRRPVGRWAVRLAAALLAPRSRVGVVGVILDPERRVLLAHHLFRPAEPWGLPGGWLHRRETPEEGLARELREELGWEVEPGPVVAVVRQRDPWHLTVGLLVRTEPREIRPSWELHGARFFELDALPDGLKPTSRRLIARALEMTA